MKLELIVTLSALIAVFAGVYTLLVFKRRREAAAPTDLNTSKD